MATPRSTAARSRRIFRHPGRVAVVVVSLVVVLNLGIVLLNNSDTSPQGRPPLPVTIESISPERGDITGLVATVSVDLQPTHVGPDATIATIIGGSAAQLVNLKIDLTHSDFRAFRVTIDRVNQGRVAVLNNLIKDSNGELGFSLNTSALGAGNYQLIIEGLDWRGDPQRDSWAALSIRH